MNLLLHRSPFGFEERRGDRLASDRHSTTKRVARTPAEQEKKFRGVAGALTGFFVFAAYRYEAVAGRVLH